MGENRTPMNDDSSHPNDDEKFNELAEIERSLGVLKPSELKSDFLRELERDQRNMHRTQTAGPGKIVMVRFIPLMAAACLVLVGCLAFQMGAFRSDPAPTNSVVANSTAPENIVPPEDEYLIDGLPPRGGDGFQPVSAQGIIRNASAGGAVQLDESGRLVREMSLEVEDVYHFHNPETKTNIRFYSPREVIIMMPVEAE